MGKRGSTAAGTEIPGQRDEAAKPAGRGPRDLPGAGSCQPRPAGASLGSQWEDFAGQSRWCLRWGVSLALPSASRGGETSGACKQQQLRTMAGAARLWYPRKSSRAMLPPHAQLGREKHVSGIINCMRVRIGDCTGRKGTRSDFLGHSEPLKIRKQLSARQAFKLPVQVSGGPGTPWGVRAVGSWLLGQILPPSHRRVNRNNSIDTA